jgi:hypothetical protein
MAVGAGRVFAINLIANSKPAEDAFKKVGQAAGRIPTPMLAAGAAITAAFAAVTAVAVKSFKALLDLGGEFNEVTRIISVGTGAVGSDLEALEQSFRNVAAMVPNAFSDVAAVVAELDTRTELSGEGLDAMAEQLLTLSRLMGGDAVSTTREVTRLFNRFGLEADEASTMLDVLFRASQASGASVDKLAADVTKNAAALIGMGLTLEESIALFAIFEREGVRSRTVVSSLQTGFAKLTQDGTVPLNQALADVFVELQTLDRTAAEARGFEIFGATSLELLDAIRDGRLSVEDFTEAIVNGERGVLETAEATDGWRVKLDELKNYLKLQFEGVAREVFDNVTLFIDDLKEPIDRVKEAFEKDGLEGALEQLAIEWDAIYADKIQPLFLKFLAFLDETVKPIALEIGSSIGAAIASGMWSAFKAGISNLFGKGLGESLFGVDFSRLDDFELTNSSSRTLDQLLADYGGSALSIPDRGRDARAYESRMLRLGDGGLVTSPVLAQVGEAGAEVVIPLDRFERQYGSGAGDVFVTVNGALDAEGTARTILRVLRDAERRSGDRLGV